MIGDEKHALHRRRRRKIESTYTLSHRNSRREREIVIRLRSRSRKSGKSFLFLLGRNIVACDDRHDLGGSRTYMRRRYPKPFGNRFPPRQSERHGSFPCLELPDCDRTTCRQHQPVGSRFQTCQPVEYPVFRRTWKSDGDQRSAIERFERSLGRLEWSNLRADGISGAFVRFPEKPFAIEDDTILVPRFLLYEFSTGHACFRVLSNNFLLFRSKNAILHFSKFFSTGFAGKHSCGYKPQEIIEWTLRVYSWTGRTA